MEKLEVGQVWITPEGIQYRIKDIVDGWIGFEDKRGQYNASTRGRFEVALKATRAKLEESK